MAAQVRSWKGPMQIMTVEPIMFLFCVSAGLEGPVISALIYEKTCLGLYNHSICDSFHNHSLSNLTKPYRDDVSTHASQFHFYTKMAYTIPCIILATFMGSWSDMLGRRLIMAMPCFGCCLFSLVYLLTAVWIDGPVGYCIIGSFLYGLFGGWVNFAMSIFSYIGDTSSKKYRTVRMTVVESFMLFGYCVSGFTSGLIYEATSYVFVFTASIFLYATLILYIYTWLDPVRPSVQEAEREASPSQDKHHIETSPDTTVITDDNNIVHSNNLVQDNSKKKEYSFAKRKGLAMFTPKHIKATFYAVFKKRPLRQRAHLLMLLLGLFAVVMGDVTSPNYLLFKNMGVDQVQWGYWTGISTAMRGLGLLFIVPLLKRFKMRDTGIMILGTLSKIGGTLLIAFALGIWMLFLSPVVGVLATAILPAIRGMVTLIVASDELGKVLAVVGLLEEVGNLSCGYLYNYWIFPKSFSWFPGLVYVVGAVVLLLALVIFGWLHIDVRRQVRYDALEEDEDTHTSPEDSSSNIQQET